MSKGLPTYKTLEYTITLPISKTVVSFRPYNVGDERNLIAAQAARDTDVKFYINNTVNVVQGAITNGVDISSLPAVDVRMLLLQQRAKSVSEIVEFTYNDNKVKVNIEELFVSNIRSPEEYKIDIGSGMFIEMRELNFSDEIEASTMVEPGKEYEVFYSILINTIKSIYNEEDVWVVGEDITKEDVKTFIYGIPKEKAQPIYDFIEKSPAVTANVVVDGKTIPVTDREADFLGSV